MLRIFILTFPFVVIAFLYFFGYLITGSTLPGIMTIVCLAIAMGILFKYNMFLRKVKKEKQQLQAASNDREEEAV